MQTKKIHTESQPMIALLQAQGLNPTDQERMAAAFHVAKHRANTTRAQAPSIFDWGTPNTLEDRA